MEKPSVLYGEKLNEFHHKSLSNIMPIKNIPSVIKSGILCHEKAMAVEHTDISMTGVQNRRKNVIIPNGKSLHSYASLYFTARNPMMYKRIDCVDSLCVLAVSLDVLDIAGCIVTDRNAASSVVRFFTPRDGLRQIDFSKVFARSWTDSDPSRQMSNKAVKCAEVLIPDSVLYSYVIGAYVANEAAKSRLIRQGFEKPVAVRPDLFFKKEVTVFENSLG